MSDSKYTTGRAQWVYRGRVGIMVNGVVGFCFGLAVAIFVYVASSYPYTARGEDRPVGFNCGHAVFDPNPKCVCAK